MVFNLAGQKVATLVEGARVAGTYTVRWDGRDDSGKELASGVYLYRLTVGEQQVETRKLMLMLMRTGSSPSSKGNPHWSDLVGIRFQRQCLSARPLHTAG